VKKSIFPSRKGGEGGGIMQQRQYTNKYGVYQQTLKLSRVTLYMVNENLFEEHNLLGCNSVQFDESPLTFRSNMSPPSSGPKSEPSKKQVASTVVRSSKTSVGFYRSTLHKNPEDGTLHSHHYQNLRSNVNVFLFVLSTKYSR
jgi:hypothetical protein